MNIRTGMWVLYRGVTGIIAEMNVSAQTAEIHRVDESGITTLVILGVPIADISQAAYGDIPEARRPDEAVARRFGYL